MIWQTTCALLNMAEEHELNGRAPIATLNQISMFPTNRISVLFRVFYTLRTWFYVLFFFPPFSLHIMHFYILKKQSRSYRNRPTRCSNFELVAFVSRLVRMSRAGVVLINVP
jgi:hypothetical protein